MNLGKLSADLEMRTQGWSSGMSKARGDLTKFSNRIESSQQKLRSFGEGAKRTGGMLTRRVSAPIAGIGALAIKTGMDFESGMLKVQAVSGATGSQLQDLENLAREMGKTTQFSASQSADALGFLAMAGFEVEDMMSALPGVLDLAAAGNLELAEAADIASNVLSGYGMEVDQLSRVNDVLAKTATSTNTSVRMLGDTMKYAAPVASAAGLEFEEVAAAAGLMGNAGIQASQAGTALRGGLSRLLNPTKQVSDALGSLGVEVMNSNGDLRPMVDILRDLESAGASTADIMQIFGTRAGPAFQAVLSQGTDALADLTQGMRDAEGTGKKMADTMMSGSKGGVLRLKSAFEGLMITISDHLLPTVVKITERAAGFMQWLSDLSPAVVKAGVVLAVLVAAAGPVLFMLGMMANGLAAVIGILPMLSKGMLVLRTNVKLLGRSLMLLAANPVALIIAAIVAVGAALVLAYKKSETFRNIVNGAIESVRDFVMPIIDNIKQVFSQLANMWNDPDVTSTGWFGKIEQFVGFLREKVDALLGWWQEIWPQFQEAAGRVWGLITGLVKAAWSIITGIFKVAMAIIKPIFKAGLAAIKKAWDLWGDDLIKILKGVWTIIEGVVKGALNVIAGIIETVLAVINGDWGKAWDGIKKIFRGVWQAIEGILDGAVMIIEGILGAALSWIRSVWDKAWAWVADRLSSARSTIGGIADSVANWLRDAFDRARAFAIEKFQALKDGAIQKAREMLAWVSGLPGRIVSAIGNLGSLLYDTGKDVVRGLWDGLMSMSTWLYNKIWAWIKRVLPGPVKKALGISSPSKVAISFGNNFAESIGRGVEQKTAAVRSRVATMMESILDRAEKTEARARRTVNSALRLGLNQAQSTLNEARLRVQDAQSAAPRALAAAGARLEGQGAAGTRNFEINLTQAGGEYNLADPQDRRRAAHDIRDLIRELEEEEHGVS